MAHRFTCLSCHVAFSTADQQRNHYRSDWHRYNLKRKVVELPPISAQEFAERLLLRQAEENANNQKSNLAYSCIVCNKTYSSENGYSNHILSKKHKEIVARKGDDTKQPEMVIARRKTDEERMKEREEKEQKDDLDAVDRKIENSMRLQLTDCLFCTSKFSTLEDTLSHMTLEHSFFIPDLEFLVDLPGLLTYLGEKISVGTACLWCYAPQKTGTTSDRKSPSASSRGIFNSLQDVRQHMIDKGHCKIAYEDDADLEVAEFYDFSSTWPEKEGESDNIEGALIRRDDGEMSLGESGLQIESLTSELILPSGKSLGHRSFARYYKQYIRPPVTEMVIIDHLSEQYKQLGYSSKHIVSKDAQRVERDRQRQQAHWEMELGSKSNKLQKYFREQVLY